MKQFFISILSYLITLSVVHSQDILTISGQLLQRSDSLPLFNAHIYFEGSGIGTTSNENGDFEFHFSNKYKIKPIHISAIGFTTQQIWYDSSNDKSLLLYFKEDLQMLNEIMVTSLEPIQILENVIKNIKLNYPQGDVNKEVYYKEEFGVNGQAIRYLEIVADIVGEGFRNKKQDPYKYDLFLKEIRPGFNMDTTFKGGNGIGVLHVLNSPKRYLKKSNFKNYTIELVGYSNYKNHPVYNLLIKSKGAFKTEASMYITTDSFALVAIAQWFENNDKSIPDYQFKFLKWNEYVDFQQLDNGYWYINSINDFRVAIDSKGDITEMKRLIRLTEVYGSSISNKKNRITRETDLYRFSTPYNPEFWKNYNAPPETEEAKRVKEMVEKN